MLIICNLHCRAGSLEIRPLLGELALALHCRAGSLESDARV